MPLREYSLTVLPRLDSELKQHRAFRQLSTSNQVENRDSYFWPETSQTRLHTTTAIHCKNVKGGYSRREIRLRTNIPARSKGFASPRIRGDQCLIELKNINSCRSSMFASGKRMI